MADWRDEFFTSDELAEIIGKRQKGKQVTWLQTQGVDHTVSLTGHPRVHRSAFVVGEAKSLTTHAPTEPNWAALEESMRRRR